MRQLAQCLDAWDVPAVSSHVYRLNEASMRFHRKLGFQAVQENAQAVAFTLRRPVVGGWMARLA
jgi:RimJ/RimL family protein N-acetyltransferase